MSVRGVLLLPEGLFFVADHLGGRLGGNIGGLSVPFSHELVVKKAVVIRGGRLREVLKRLELDLVIWISGVRATAKGTLSISTDML